MSAGTLSNNITQGEIISISVQNKASPALTHALSPRVFPCKAATEGTGLVNSTIACFFLPLIFFEKEPSF